MVSLGGAFEQKSVSWAGDFLEGPRDCSRENPEPSDGENRHLALGALVQGGVLGRFGLAPLFITD
jgi:hypothetical protein